MLDIFKMFSNILLKKMIGFFFTEDTYVEQLQRFTVKTRQLLFFHKVSFGTSSQYPTFSKTAWPACLYLEALGAEWIISPIVQA